MIDITHAVRTRIRNIPTLERALLGALASLFVLSLILYLVFYPGTRKPVSYTHLTLPTNSRV